MALTEVRVRGSTWREVILQFDDLTWVNIVRGLLFVVGGVLVIVFTYFLVESLSVNETPPGWLFILYILFSGLFAYAVTLPKDFIQREVEKKKRITVNGKKYTVTKDTELRIDDSDGVTVIITNLLVEFENGNNVAYM